MPDKLRHHHSDNLLMLVKLLQQQGDMVIIPGDFNEELGLTQQSLTRLLTKCHPIDPILHRHGFTDFSTYQHGSKIIDYILIDLTLLPSITAAGSEPYGNNLLSDHQGVYINLNTAWCFGSTIRPLLLMQLRGLSTKQCHQIAPYFQHKIKHLKDHNWFHGLQTLQQCMDQQTTDNHNLTDKQYNRLILASQYAARQLKQYLSHHSAPLHCVKVFKIGTYTDESGTRSHRAAHHYKIKTRHLRVLQYTPPTLSWLRVPDGTEHHDRHHHSWITPHARVTYGPAQIQSEHLSFRNNSRTPVATSTS